MSNNYEDILKILEFLDKNDGNYPPGIEETITNNINDKFHNIDVYYDFESPNYHYYEKMMNYVKFIPTNIIKEIYVGACKLGKIKIVKSILTRGDAADINKFSDGNEGYDGFGFACKNGYVEIVKLIIDKFDAIKEMNAADNYFGFTRTCKYGHIEILNMLVENYREQLSNIVTDKETFKIIRGVFCYILKIEEENYKKTVEIMLKLYGNAISPSIVIDANETVSEIADENKQLKEKIEQLSEENSRLKEENTRLEEKLSKISNVVSN